MKKTLLLIIVFVGLLLCAVGYTDSHYRTALGHRMPSLCISDADSLVADYRSKGECVLVNFWNSADAPSRRQANDYTAWLRRNPGQKVGLVSVNVDSSKGMFSEIVDLDGLAPSTQFHASGESARALYDNFGLSDGLGTLLIDPSGKIIAHNPTEAQLNQILPRYVK